MISWPNLTVLSLALTLISACSDTADGDPSELCEPGIYRADDPEFVVLTRTETGFRYTFSTGIVGQVGENASSLRCSEEAVLIDGERAWPKVALEETDTVFQSGSARLTGRLIEAPGARANTPLVVYAHGSERRAWIERMADPYQMVGRGISVFVYDKRGTGSSSGEYSQNFPQLAQDLVAASAEAKRLAQGRYGRFGLIGLSQGGWIAPLAASPASADFIGIGYGLAVTMQEEDASQVEKALSDRGYEPEVIRKARELTDITARIVESDFSDGLDDFADFQDQHSQEAWFGDIQGGYTSVLLNIPVAELRENGVPEFDGLNVDWSHRPMDVLREVTAPQLWVLAGEDREAPIAETITRLQALRSGGQAVSIFVFPDTDHGLFEFTESADGSREYTRVAVGYYDLMADWAKGELNGPYGRGTRE